MKHIHCWPLAGAALLVSQFAGAADSLENLSFAVLGGAPNLDLRTRYEHVDNETSSNPRDSSALTARTRLGYTTGKWNNLDAQLEYEGTAAYREKSYNSGLNTVKNRPAIADPVGNELNQYWLRYTGLPWTTLKLGRQRYTLDNQRFIGNVGWRQNEQTYDGGSLLIKPAPLPALEINYAYFHNVNTPAYANVPLSGAHLVNIAYSFGDALKLVGYSYWLNFETPSSAANRQDSRSTGLRATGSYALPAQLRLSYAAEYAQQRRYADATSKVDADYWNAEAGLSYAYATLKLGYELLGSHDGLYGFQTPLATLHAFDGWADQFLTTPNNGLQHKYASLALTQWKTTATLVWHGFKADETGAAYGEEFDASLSRPITKQLSVLAKYASYDARGFSSDTGKFWLQAEFKF